MDMNPDERVLQSRRREIDDAIWIYEMVECKDVDTYVSRVKFSLSQFVPAQVRSFI